METETIIGPTVMAVVIGGPIFLLLHQSPEQKKGLESYRKWSTHKDAEWIKCTFEQIPKFLNSTLRNKITDKAIISNLRNCVDLYRQLDDLGIINDLKESGYDFLMYFQLDKKYPYKHFEDLSIEKGITGTHISFVFRNQLRIIVPHIKEDIIPDENIDKFADFQIKQHKKEEKKKEKLRSDVLKLIEEIKLSTISHDNYFSEIMAKDPKEIYLMFENSEL